jgi:hypothetical protein
VQSLSKVKPKHNNRGEFTMHHHSRFKPRNSAIRHATAILIGLTMAAAGNHALAQSNATTTIYGEVASPAGATGAGKPGHRRAAYPPRMRQAATSPIPCRRAVAARVVRGGTVQDTREIEAVVGSGAEVNFGAALGENQTVVVRAARNYRRLQHQ